jgi:hypothetical protein
MNNQILKSNSSFILIGDNPAWKTTSETGRLFSLVQDSSFSVNMDRQTAKQLGYQNYCINDLVKAPDVILNIDYYLSPFLINESLLGFGCNTPSDTQVIGSINNKNYNFYIVTDNDELKDGFDEIKRTDTENINFSGFSVLSFGNCYLTKYSVNFSNNQIPKASISLKCSNMKFESLTGNNITIPAVNPQNGTSNSAGNFNLKDLYLTVTGANVRDVLNRSEYNPPILKPYNTKFNLKNLEIGGIPLQQSSSPILKSFNLDINFERVDLYGFGSNYVFDRKLQYPVNAQINISASVSGFNSGFLSGILKNETGYDLDVTIYDTVELDNVTGYYKFKNTKLNSFNYSMRVNEIMDFNAQFSLPLTDNSGFLMSKVAKEAGSYWVALNSDWNLINKSWQNV